MTHYTYLLVNFLTIIVCFIFSFDSRIRFNSYFLPFLKGSLVVAIPFLAWDVWFTDIGIWWFNDKYLIGLRLFGLPIEEWLFFVCIPFSSVYTYFCLDKFFDLQWADKFGRLVTITSVSICLISIYLFHDRLYTVLTALVTATVLIYLQYMAKVTWVGRASFVHLVLMLGFIPVNGVLTGTGLESPVVNYNPSGILKIRILTIPLEDFVYGYSMILLNLYFFTIFKNKAKPSTSASCS